MTSFGARTLPGHVTLEEWSDEASALTTAILLSNAEILRFLKGALDNMPEQFVTKGDRFSSENSVNEPISGLQLWIAGQNKGLRVLFPALPIFLGRLGKN